MSAGRALAFLLVAWAGLIGVAAIGAAFPSLPQRVPAPDVVLLVVLYVGLSGRGELASTCALAVCLGWFADLFAGSPKGLHMVACAAVGLTARAASSRLLVRGGVLTALVAYVFALLSGTLLVALLTSLWPQLGWGALRIVPLQALSTAVCAPFAFRVLARFDRRYRRDPNAARGLASGASHPSARATAAQFARLVDEEPR